MVICLILCCILSLQTVIAADADNVDTNGTLASNDVNDVKATNELELLSHSDTDDVLGDPAGSFRDLQTEIAGTGSGGTLELVINYTYNSGTDSAYVDGISINKQITIKGMGNIVIDAQQKARIFDISGQR